MLKVSHVIFMAVNCKQTIQFTNVLDNETFSFSLILVKGIINVNGFNESEDLIIHYLKNNDIIKNVKIRVFHCNFVVLLNLEPGKNEFAFSIRENVVKKTFFYILPNQNFVVTPVYIICKDDTESKFNKAIIQTICEKISVGCRIIQTLIAETLSHYGFGKKTFVLENDDLNGNNRCLIFNTSLSFNSTVDITSEELWEYFGRELMTSEYGSENRKFLAFFSRKMGKFSKELAIGGGGLALCDLVYLNTWPTSVDDVSASFMNRTSVSLIPSFNTIPNSCLGWNNFSASIGAVCHELCHTFDLGHSVSGIMGKDFERINLIFVSDQDLNSLRTSSYQNFICDKRDNSKLNITKCELNPELNMNYSVSCISSPNEDLRFYEDKKFEKQNISSRVFSNHVFWSEGCATLLAYHKWINHTRSEVVKVKPNINQFYQNTIQYDVKRRIITSIHGIAVVQLRHQSEHVIKSWTFHAKQKTLFLVPICEARRASIIVIEDMDGNMLKKEMENIL